MRTHRGAQTTIDLENSKLVQILVVFRGREIGVRNDLVLSGGFDTIPLPDVK